MRKRKAGMLLGFIIATLVLVVGYATVTNINLSVTGTASAEASDENFNVQMVAGSLNTDGTSTNVSVTDNTTNAEKQLNVNFVATGFSAKGDKAVITYTIENSSNDLVATLESTGVVLSVPANTTDTTYYAKSNTLFDAEYYFGSTEGTKTVDVSSQANSNTTTVTVVLTLNKTIVDEQNVVVNVNLPITAKAK